jgi:hypothetical protein
MATITNPSVATQAGARPQLLTFLRTLVEQSHETPATPASRNTTVTPTVTANTPAPTVPLAGSWQDAWIDKHSEPVRDDTASPVALVTLHPIATAVRAVLGGGQWDLPKPEQHTKARGVVLGGAAYQVVVAPAPIVPNDVIDSNEGWIVTGSTEPWGHPVSSRLQGVLDSLARSDTAWAPMYSACAASELASSLVFGPYDERFAAYSEAAAAAPPDGFVLSLAVEPMSVEIEALGFGSSVSVGTNLPSTHRPITRAGRTSK